VGKIKRNKVTLLLVFIIIVKFEDLIALTTRLNCAISCTSEESVSYLFFIAKILIKTMISVNYGRKKGVI